MDDIDVSGLSIDQLSDLVGKVQSEMASRERQRRTNLRSELERRLTADGYRAARHLPRARYRRREPATAPEDACKVPESAES